MSKVHWSLAVLFGALLVVLGGWSNPPATVTANEVAAAPAAQIALAGLPDVPVVGTPCAITTTIQGMLTGGDSRANQRLARYAGAATCAAPHTCPGPVNAFGPFAYDAYTFTNNEATAQCVTAVITTGCDLQLAVYLGTFDPNNACTNYLADAGDSTLSNGSASTSFLVPPGADFVVVVDNPNGTGNCSSYTLRVGGCGPAATATITPSATVTATASPTRTPVLPTATRTPVLPTATRTLVVPTATATATAQPTCASDRQTYNGSITGEDAGHLHYLSVGGNPSSCGVTQNCPTIGGVQSYHYDTYQVVNVASSPRCYTLVVDASSCGGSQLQVELYRDSFDPTNLCANYLGDSGGNAISGQTTMTVTVPANTTMIVVVEEYTSSVGCTAYTLQVTSPPCAITATPTRTAGVVTATATRTPGSVTVTATRTPGTVTPTVTPCGIQFSDVTDPTAYYYQGVYYLACQGVLSGYSDGTFKPFNNTTRAQMTKIVTLAFNIPTATPPAGGSFADVDSSSVFYGLIETAAAHGLVSGYTCGGVNPQTGAAEPCTAGNRPYFRPSNFVTRGQLTKIVVLGAGWALQTPERPSFSDVAVSNVFYPFIETAVCRGVVSGYSDNTFRPTANAFRGQIAKIVYLAVTGASTCAP